MSSRNLNKPIKLALLIMAHKDIELTNRLLSVVSNPHVDVYLHVDKKCDDSFRNSLKGDFYLIPRENSEDIQWGFSGGIRAEEKLLRTAFSKGDYSHFALISAQDYPLRDMTELLDFLGDNPNRDFIDIIQNDETFQSRYLLYWPDFLIGREKWQRPIRGFYKTIGMALPFIQRKVKPASRLYCGSQWWVLRASVVKWMLHELENRDRWISFYSHSLNPDEGLFQTLYMASPFKNDRDSILTYIDWSEHGSSPKTLDVSDLDAMRESGKFFARKFDLAVDSSVLDFLPFHDEVCQ